MVLLVDNYDSFVHNLARYVRELGEDTVVVRNDEMGLAEIARLAPSHIIISPGPCTPNEAGISNDVIRAFGPSVPILGVCLGHQCVAQVYGARVVRAPAPVHGKASAIVHDGQGLFEGLPNPFRAGRYHSLIVPQASLPAELRAVAWTHDGELLMGLRHCSFDVWGVQFHPESILTEHGHTLLRHFLVLGSQAEAA
jgi:anthranilate synthase/aminodeoxychorismate synthase-like glutamine amidotransferase